MPATQGILTYCTNRTLPYHLYADESGLLVLAALLTSASLSKTLSEEENLLFLFSSKKAQEILAF